MFLTRLFDEPDGDLGFHRSHIGQQLAQVVVVALARTGSQ